MCVLVTEISLRRRLKCKAAKSTPGDCQDHRFDRFSEWKNMVTWTVSLLTSNKKLVKLQAPPPECTGRRNAVASFPKQKLQQRMQSKQQCMAQDLFGDLSKFTFPECGT